jgi:uncharacterized membrane protein YdbT with pleckstrin-like domain
MGNFVDKNLDNEETIKYSARVSLWKYWINFLIAGLIAAVALLGFAAYLSSKRGTQPFAGPKFALVMLLMSLAIFAWPLVARKSTELVITSNRLIAKFGVVSTQSIDIRFDRIETVRVKQSLIGRIFNYGDIVVTGTGSTFDPIPNIANPMGFRAALNQALETAPSSRGASARTNAERSAGQ